MDAAWIQVFVLTMAECVAPAGKTVCQESEFELLFLTQSDCEIALEQFVMLKDAADNVIVDKTRSGCAPSARQQPTFASLSDLSAAVEDKSGWKAPEVDEPTPTSSRSLHQARLEGLKTCEESEGIAPCRIGEIIIEEATEGETVEVWRRE